MKLRYPKLLVLLSAGQILTAVPAWCDWTPEQVPREILTLGEAQQRALQQHPRLLAEEYNVAAAEDALRLAQAGYLPQISAYADRTFAGSNTRIGATPTLTDPTIIDRGSLGVEAGQLITDFGKTEDLVESARYGAQAQRDETAVTADSVVLGVTAAYYGVLRAQALLRVAQSTVLERATLLRRVEAMRDARLKSDLDVSVAQQVSDQANLLQLSARGDLEAARATLAQALGSTTLGDISLRDDANPPPLPPGNLDALIAQAMADNPELAAQQENAEAAAKTADSARAARLPTLSALGYAGYNPLGNPAQHVNPSYFAGGITLTVPLYEGGLLEAQERESRHRAEAAAESAEDTRNQLVRDVDTASAVVNTAYDVIAVTDHLVATARTSLRLMQVGFELGRNSVVDLSQAELASTESEIAAADARYQYLSKLAVLDYVTGSMKSEYFGYRKAQ